MPPAPVLIAAALAGIAWYLGDEAYQHILIPVAHATVHALHIVKHFIVR